MTSPREIWRERLVSNTAISEAFKPRRLNNGALSQHGMGWMLDSDPQPGRIVHHPRHNPGYANHTIRLIDKDLTVIILTDNSFEPPDGLSKDLIAAFGGH